MKTLLTLILGALLLVGCGARDTDTQPAPETETVTTYKAGAPKADKPAEVATSDTPDAEPAIVDEPEPEPVDEPIEPADLPDETVDELYISLLRGEYPTAFLGVPDRDVINLGKGICDMFDIGQSFEDVGVMGMQAGYEADEIGGLIGAATVAYCPEHTDKY